MEKYNYRQAVKEAILTFLGDNVDYYICPEDYETREDFKDAIFHAIYPDSDLFDNYETSAADCLKNNRDLLAEAISAGSIPMYSSYTEEDKAIRFYLLRPVLDEIFQESITEEDFIAMKAERE